MVTADFSLRRGKPLPMKESVDARAAATARRSSTAWSCAAPAATCRGPTGRDVWWHEAIEAASADCPAEPFDAEQMLYPALHVGHDREAEGHRAHDRRLPDRRGRHAQPHLRHQAGDATSTGAPPTSAGSPATATSSTGRSPTAAPRSSTRARPTTRTRTAGGRSSSATRRTIFYTAPTAIRACIKWGREYPDRHDLSRCGCSAASASRSTRAPGSGTTR